jgi:hypothetical protein
VQLMMIYNSINENPLGSTQEFKTLTGG